MSSNATHIILGKTHRFENEELSQGTMGKSISIQSRLLDLRRSSNPMPLKDQVIVGWAVEMVKLKAIVAVVEFCERAQERKSCQIGSEG